MAAAKESYAVFADGLIIARAPTRAKAENLKAAFTKQHPMGFDFSVDVDKSVKTTSKKNSIPKGKV